MSENVLVDIARRCAILGILAVGMTFLFVGGEFDLSIGSHYGFLLILLAKLIDDWGHDPWVAALLVILLGGVIGTINGLLVTRIGLPSFIATLGMLILLRGAANTLSSGYPIPAKNTDLFFYQIIRADFAGTHGAQRVRADAGRGRRRRRSSWRGPSSAATSMPPAAIPRPPATAASTRGA